MGNITIFTDVYSAENKSEIINTSLAGNLVPIQLTSSDGLRDYYSAVSCVWDNAYIPDETFPEDAIIEGLVQAFGDLQAGIIDAITMSIPTFLLLQERPEFNPEPTPKITHKSRRPR